MTSTGRFVAADFATAALQSM